MAASYVGRLLGGKALKKSLLGWIPIALILVLANMLSVHNGETILFFLNGNPITMEAGIRGLLMSVSLWTILLWGLTMQMVITQDQLIWLFGKWAPRLGLTIGMILHYIPELHRKYRSVHAAELAMGHEGETGFSRKLQSVKEFSTVVSWSLEDSIETGDAMEARGYGLPGRSSYSPYRMERRDAFALAIVLLLGFVSILGILLPTSRVQTYPTFDLPQWNATLVMTDLVYLILCSLPGLIQWRVDRVNRARASGKEETWPRY